MEKERFEVQKKRNTVPDFHLGYDKAKGRPFCANLQFQLESRCIVGFVRSGSKSGVKGH